MLHTLFAAIDGLCDKHRVQKIETIGDAYLAGPYTRPLLSSTQAVLSFNRFMSSCLTSHD